MYIHRRIYLQFGIHRIKQTSLYFFCSSIIYLKLEQPTCQYIMLNTKNCLKSMMLTLSSRCDGSHTLHIRNTPCTLNQWNQWHPDDHPSWWCILAKNLIVYLLMKKSVVKKDKIQNLEVRNTHCLKFSIIYAFQAKNIKIVKILEKDMLH